MHGMHRHRAKRKRGCIQKQRAEIAYEHVKVCQQHACNIVPHRRRAGVHKYVMKDRRKYEEKKRKKKRIAAAK
jgi:hypothetical protein